jgi:hypothetical protein
MHGGLKISTNLENLENLENLDSLDENLDAAKSRLKSLDFKNIDNKKSWSRHDGHSRRFSKASLDTKDVLDLDLDWSRLSRPPCLINSERPETKVTIAFKEYPWLHFPNTGNKYLGERLKAYFRKNYFGNKQVKVQSLIFESLFSGYCLEIWEIMSRGSLFSNVLFQGFPTCGTRTTGGTWTGFRLYAEILKWKLSQ